MTEEMNKLKKSLAKNRSLNEHYAITENESLKMQVTAYRNELSEAQESIRKLKENSVFAFEPLRVAEMLIYTKTEMCDKNGDILAPRRYEVDELRQIAEHLMTYINHVKEESDGWF